jgi:hypothetical protein
LASAWLVGSQRRGRRNAGFCLFLLSNALWITWGWYDEAHALVVLQACLAVLNLRGAIKNNPQDTDTARHDEDNSAK